MKYIFEKVFSQAETTYGKRRLVLCSYQKSDRLNCAGIYNVFFIPSFTALVIIPPAENRDMMYFHDNGLVYIINFLDIRTLTKKPKVCVINKLYSNYINETIDIVNIIGIYFGLRSEFIEGDVPLPKMSDLEKKALSAIIQKIGKEGDVKITEMCDETNISRSIYKSLLNKLQESRIASVVSRGSKGNHIKFFTEVKIKDDETNK